MNPESLLDIAKLQLADRYERAARHRFWHRSHSKQL
jgi:hypothetical protein